MHLLKPSVVVLGINVLGTSVLGTNVLGINVLVLINLHLGSNEPGVHSNCGFVVLVLTGFLVVNVTPVNGCFVVVYVGRWVVTNGDPVTVVSTFFKN